MSDTRRHAASSLYHRTNAGGGSGSLTVVSERDIAFPTLNAAQVATLAARGHRRAVAAGDVLFAEGDRGF
jgi:hypothetical protein